MVWLSIAEALLVGDLLVGLRSSPADPARTPARPPSRATPLSIRAAAVACAATVALLLLRVGDEHQLRGSPVETVDRAYGEIGDDGTYLGDLDSSALLLWKHPDAAGHVLFDPRLEVFAAQDLARWNDFQDDDPSNDWDGLLEEADVVMASETWRPRLADRLEREPGTATRTDDGVVLLPE